MSQDACIPPGGSTGPKPPRSDLAERVQDHREVITGWSKDEAIQAAGRCLAAYTCTFCEVCGLLCPDQCITRDPQSGHILIDLNHCKGCGLCAHFCPKGAIQMEPEPGGG